MSARLSPLSAVRTPRFRLAAGALLALALAGCAAGIVAGPSWFAPAVVPLVLALQLLRAARRRPDAGLLGPLFFSDLVRLARRGRGRAVRCLYALLLLGALCFAYHAQFPRAPLFDLSSVRGPDVPVGALASFAEMVSLTLLLAQGVAALALTPAYVGGAVAEEKERRTLELLFTSHLSDREIVLGKLLARLAHLGGVFLAGAPVLCLTLLWGGVSAPALVAGFAVVGATLFSVGGASVLCSVLSRTTLAALVSSYAVVAVFSLFCLCSPIPLVSSPVAFVVVLHKQLANSPPGAVTATAGASSVLTLTPLDMTNLYVGLHLLIGWACTALAVSQVRVVALAEAAGAPSLPRVVPASAATGPAGAAVLPDAPPAEMCPPVGDRPLLWKEVYRAGPHAAGLASREMLSPGCWFIGLGVLCYASVWVIAAVDRGQALREALNVLCRALGVILAGAWCLATAYAAAGSVSRERGRGTLDGLLTLPVGRGAVLGAKWLGSILRWRTLGLALLGLWALGLLMGALHPLGVLLSALAFAVCLALLAGVGLWLSLVSRNTLWATVNMAAVLLFLFLVPWFVWLNLDYRVAVNEGWETHFGAWGLNPLAAWWFVGFSWPEVSGLLGAGPEADLLRARLLAVLAGLALQAAVAAGAWLLALRRLCSTYGR